MNSAEEGWARRLCDACSPAGRAAHLADLHVKTILKEAHCAPVAKVAFNDKDPRKRNLFATVGGSQCTVYDAEHLGGFVGVVAAFVNDKTEHTAGGTLSALEWLAPDAAAAVEEGDRADALLAVGGADCAVSVVSVRASAVVALLKGHSKPIVDLAAGARAPHLVVSLAKDEQLRVWDWRAEECLRVLDAGRTSSIALAPDASRLFAGGHGGELSVWSLPADILAGGAADSTPGGKRKRAGADMVVPLASVAAAFGEKHGSRVDCVQVVGGSKVATKSTDGTLNLWNVDTGARAAGWKVPGCAAGGSAERSHLGATSDGAYVVAGNQKGETFVFGAADGAVAARLSTEKLSSAVRAAAVSDCCRHVLSVLGNGFIFRHEYVAPPPVDADA